MKLPDVNVLVSGVHRQALHHPQARQWLETAFESTQAVAMTWTALIGFIRVSTRPGIFEQPLSVEDALGAVEQWLQHPNALVVGPGPRHAPLLSSLLLAAGRAGNLTTDAHLAAMAIEHGATLVSFDRDFQRFAGLRLERLGA